MSANKDSAYGYLLTVLKNATITVDWKGVANELGSQYPGNCSTKFNGILKAEGLKLEKGKVIEMNGQSATSKKAKATPKKTPSKRKAKVDVSKSEDESESEPPAKSMKLSSENDAEESDA